MLSPQNPVSTATRFQMESNLEATATLVDKTVDSLEKLADLNMNLARATLEQSNLAARQLLAAEDMHEIITLTAGQIQPNARCALDYGYYLTLIASSGQSECIKTISMRAADTSRMLAKLMEDIGKVAANDCKAAG